MARKQPPIVFKDTLYNLRDVCPSPLVPKGIPKAKVFSEGEARISCCCRIVFWDDGTGQQTCPMPIELYSSSGDVVVHSECDNAIGPHGKEKGKGFWAECVSCDYLEGLGHFCASCGRSVCTNCLEETKVCRNCRNLPPLKESRDPNGEDFEIIVRLDNMPETHRQNGWLALADHFSSKVMANKASMEDEEEHPYSPVSPRPLAPTATPPPAAPTIPAAAKDPRPNTSSPLPTFKPKTMQELIAPSPFIDLVKMPSPPAVTNVAPAPAAPTAAAPTAIPPAPSSEETTDEELHPWPPVDPEEMTVGDLLVVVVGETHILGQLRRYLDGNKVATVAIGANHLDCADVKGGDGILEVPLAKVYSPTSNVLLENQQSVAYGLAGFAWCRLPAYFRLKCLRGEKKDLWFMSQV